MAISLCLHLFSAMIWVGGMFFAMGMLRPAVENLVLVDKVHLWLGVLNRFFSWIRVIVILQPATGYWMVFHELGGFDHVGFHVIIMHFLGWIMILIFLWIYFFPFRHMKRMAREELFPEAGMYMLRIRGMVLANLVLGAAVSTLAVVGPFI